MVRIDSSSSLPKPLYAADMPLPPRPMRPTSRVPSWMCCTVVSVRRVLRPFIPERRELDRVRCARTQEVLVLLNPDHVTVAVTDPDAAIEFFELLGFRKGHVATIDGGEPAAYMLMPDMTAQHITLALEGPDPRFEIQLLVFDPVPGEDRAERPSNKRRRGYNHLAFRVDDIAAVSERLVAHGVTMLNDEMDYISRKLRFFEGPEGITLELV